PRGLRLVGVANGRGACGRGSLADHQRGQRADLPGHGRQLPGPVGALIAGVEAAAAVKAAGQQVGFNWFYRLDPLSDRNFWSALGTRGGEAFRQALDYAGVDIYAGTYIPPLYSLNDEADFRTALEYVRCEMMPLASLGAEVPIYVQEFGYPTLAPLRSEAKQAEALPW